MREDALLLFGFAEPDELRLFDLLIGVSGVGPKLALAALSGLAPGGTRARDPRGADLGAIVAVPGIGRKTAERLVVELRDKLDFLPAASGPAAARGREAGDPAALRALRRRRRGARHARLFCDAGAGGRPQGRRGAAATSPLEDLVKRALMRLAKPAVVSR